MIVDHNFTRHYNPEDSSEHHTRRRENLKSQTVVMSFHKALNPFTAHNDQLTNQPNNITYF
jgi:hypothetical protein